MRANLPRLLAVAMVLAVLAIPTVQYRHLWMRWFAGNAEGPGSNPSRSPAPPAIDQVVLSRNAQLNLRPDAQPLVPEETYWRYVRLPGIVVDRPGFSDRGVVAPAAGVVTKIHALPGDAARPGEPLFTLRLISESLHATQADLGKTTRDVQFALDQKKRALNPNVRDALPASTLLELDAQLRRFEASIRGFRQELQTRGLTAKQIDQVAEGQFVTEIDVLTPRPVAAPKRPGANGESSGEALAQPVDVAPPMPPGPEVQELKVELGQQVQAGQPLCVLADHHSLNVEGRGFRQEIRLVEQAAREGWTVDVEFLEQNDALWPELKQSFQIRHISNTLDPTSRTFAFYLPLANESHVYQKDGRELRTWRFRPGQRVRLGLRAEKFTNVFVLPADAVVREGPEAYVFQQKGEAFLRKSVHVLDQDRDHAVIARDDNLPLGIKVARHGALQINRVLKSKGGELPPGYHMHADGTVHAPH